MNGGVRLVTMIAVRFVCRLYRNSGPVSPWGARLAVGGKSPGQFGNYRLKGLARVVLCGRGASWLRCAKLSPVESFSLLVLSSVLPGMKSANGANNVRLAHSMLRCMLSAPQQVGKSAVVMASGVSTANTRSVR